MSEYFPKLKSLRAKVKVELDLSNYVTKADLKNVSTDFSNLKSKIDKFDADKT